MDIINRIAEMFLVGVMGVGCGLLISIGVTFLADVLCLMVQGFQNGRSNPTVDRSRTRTVDSAQAVYCSDESCASVQD